MQDQNENLDALFEDAISIEEASANIPLALPPAGFIETELDVRCWTQEDLAQIIGRSTKFVSQLLNNKVRITDETAELLARAFDKTPHFWMGLEFDYRRDMKQGKPELLEVELRAKLKHLVPGLTDAIKKGMIAAGNTIYERLDNLLDLLQIEKIDDLENSNISNLRLAPLRTESREQNIAMVAIWVKSAKKYLTERKGNLTVFNKAGIEGSLDRFRKLTLQGTNGFIEAVEVLSQNGVTVMYHAKLPKTTIGGTAFWIDDQRAGIALALRKKSLDENWFILMHELGHILTEGYFEDFETVVGREAIDDPKEIAANQFAADVFINQENWTLVKEIASQYKKRKRIIPFSEIEKFSARFGIHKEIICGRLRHFSLINNSTYQKAQYKEPLDIEQIKEFLLS